MWVITLRWLHWYKFVVVLHGGVNVLIAEFCHCLHIKHFICLWLLRKVIYVVICWLLCWQNVSQYISCVLCPQQNHRDYYAGTERWRWYYRFKCLNDAIQQPIDLTVPFLWTGQISKTFVRFQGRLSTPPQLRRLPVRHRLRWPHPHPHRLPSHSCGLLRCRQTTATTREARSPTIFTNS